MPADRRLARQKQGLAKVLPALRRLAHARHLISAGLVSGHGPISLKSTLREQRS
jgi:hypothetical protein